MSDLFDSDIDKAKEQWYIDIWTTKGVICPVCDRFGKVGKNRLGIGEAISLGWIYHKSGEEGRYIHCMKTATRYLCNTNRWGYLVKRGLLDKMPVDPNGKTASSGQYRINAVGRAYYEGKITAVKHVYTYNRGVMDNPEDPIEMIDFKEAITSAGFDINEVRQAAIKGKELKKPKKEKK